LETVCLVTVRKGSLLGNILHELMENSGKSLHLIYSEAATPQDFMTEVDSSKAAVVLLEKSSPLADEEAIAKLLTLFSKLLVIVISPDSNLLNIYRREDKLLLSSVDLVDAVHSRLDNPTQSGLF
jgi:hypothetical protein